MKMVITINREYASGGRIIGEMLAKRLGIPFYDRKLIELAAENSGLAPDFIEETQSRPTNTFWQNLARGTNFTVGYCASDEVYAVQCRTIREVAEQGSCVIVGRCAGYVLREMKDKFSIFIHAPVADRVKRAIETYGVDPYKAMETVTQHDKGRANYYRTYCEDNWADLHSYDMTINSSTCGLEGTVDLLVDAIKDRFGLNK